jgi:glutamate-1-semialdehyde 2,1-aminomutase
MPATTERLFEAAKKFIPGGVNSPVRSFQAVGGQPIFIKKAIGPYLIAQDNTQYLDYVGSWGPMILGHSHPAVISAVQAACENGLSFGAPTVLETQLAEKICTLMPNIEMVRMVNSGTEATMTAIRLARGYTGKNKIIKFTGCYHGHHDSLLVEAGSGLLTLGIPSSPGIPESVTQHTLTADFNNITQVAELFTTYGEDIAGVILEPIAGNMGMILPKPNFLAELRTLCDQHHSVLIFDEVMTGFRVALGGAQSLYAIKPDLTTLGKIVGGGLPVGALGGKRKIMEYLAPMGPVYQAGTLSGNPIAMTAGLVTLDLIQQDDFYKTLQNKSSQLVNGLVEAARAAQIPFCGRSLGGMFGFNFSEANELGNFQAVQACNIKRFNQFFQRMLAQNIYFAPSAFEAGFISAAHQEQHIQATIDKASKVFKQL